VNDEGEGLEDDRQAELCRPTVAFGANA